MHGLTNIHSDAVENGGCLGYHYCDNLSAACTLIQQWPMRHRRAFINPNQAQVVHYAVSF